MKELKDTIDVILKYSSKKEQNRVNMDVRQKYEQLTRLLIKNDLSITTMESCTSGLIASLITDTEGASAIMKGACITYSNEAKVMDGVPKEIIDNFGVYSKETALAMSKACKNKFGADIGIGITGSFGNVDPNNPDSVPGEIYFSISFGDDEKAFHQSIPSQPSRHDYKLYAAELVADKLFDTLSEKGLC